MYSKWRSTIPTRTLLNEKDIFGMVSFKRKDGKQIPDKEYKHLVPQIYSAYSGRQSVPNMALYPVNGTVVIAVCREKDKITENYDFVEQVAVFLNSLKVYEATVLTYDEALKVDNMFNKTAAK